jgi:DNA polymerase-3 subunit epsilon
MKFAVVDLETTGGSAIQDRIVEIGIVWFEDGQITREYRQLIQPEVYIRPSLTLIHGISNDMVADAPTFADLADEIEELTADRIFVAHNVQFDFSFLKESFRRLGRTFDRRKICTVRLSKKLHPQQRSHSLKSLCQVYQVRNERAHRALEDARATAIILGHLLHQEGSDQIVRQLLSGKAGINLLPPNLPYGRLETLPEGPGVYLFHDAKGQVVYVGKAINLRDRVRQHFSGHTHTGTKRAFLDSIFELSFQEAGHEFMALLLENELIKKHYPRFNSSQKEFRLNHGIFPFPDQLGRLRLVIGQSGKWTKPLCVFRGRDEAVSYLLKTSLRYGLCLRLNQILDAESHECSYTSEEGLGCGICTGGLSVEDYNLRVEKAISEALAGQSLLLKTTGRIPKETGMVWVEKGKIMGMGYIPDSGENMDFLTLKSHLNAYYDTQDAQSILRSWLEKAEQEAPLSEGIPVFRLS